MVKKDKEIVKDVKDSAQKIWLAGLGAFALAEEEGGKLFDKLVKRGEGLESKGREEMDKVIKNLAAMRGRAEGTFGKVERKLDEQVAVVLAKMGVPSKDEISTLTARVEELTTLVEKLKPGKPVAGHKGTAHKG